MGGDLALVGIAVLMPLVYVLLIGAHPRDEDGTGAGSRLTSRQRFQPKIAEWAEKTRTTALRSAIFKIEIDATKELIDRFGELVAEAVAMRVGERIVATLRTDDLVAKTSDYGFTACLTPVQQLDLELCMQLAGRIQTALEEPISVDGTVVYITSSVGFAEQNKKERMTPRAWMEAAGIALREAQAHGTGSIRSYSVEMKHRVETRAELRQEVATALESGQIRPWFQPQISTDTGLVTGFEALARWHHPERGMISPADFLPVIEQTDMLEALAEVMTTQALAAVKAWDAAGQSVPQVGVNFAGPELGNPRLVDKVKWELDRFELTPERLAVEVLETVVANAGDDTITRNINGLADLGCQIDLDDFGTGHASIASIRRFSVGRIKIDRSFVMRADRDSEQQRMISAILTMAERLNVKTLAEGVETVGEHALLAQLGCDHVQGFGIGKPMPFDETIEWMEKHNAKLADVPHILGNKAS